MKKKKNKKRRTSRRRQQRIKPPDDGEGPPYNSRDGMSTKCWGPVAWFHISCVARNYPVHPTKAQQKHYKLFFDNFFKTLPCGACRKNAVKNLHEIGFHHKITFQTRETLSRAINRLHNAVNRMTGSGEEWTYEEHRDFFEQFRAKCVGGHSHKHSGCYGPSSAARFDRPTAMIVVADKKESDKFKHDNHCGSVVCLSDK